MPAPRRACGRVLRWSVTGFGSDALPEIPRRVRAHPAHRRGRTSRGGAAARRPAPAPAARCRSCSRSGTRPAAAQPARSSCPRHRRSACSTRSPRRADPTSLNPGQFISGRGAIVSRHSATQSLLKRSITGISQVSSCSDRRQPTDTISFASRSQRGFIPFRCPMGIRPRTSRPLSSCFRPLEGGFTRIRRRWRRVGSIPALSCPCWRWRAIGRRG